MKYAMAIGLIWAASMGCSHVQKNTDDQILIQEPYKVLTDSIADFNTMAELYYKRGSLLLQNEQPALAEKDMRVAWQLNHEEKYALGLLKVLRIKNADSALHFTRQATALLPNSIALKISLARDLQENKQLDSALKICNELIAQYPNQLDALQLKSEILTAQNKNEEALTTLETAYSYAPFDAELAHSLAFAYAQAHNKKVIALCDSLIKADVTGTHGEPYYFKGVYFANLKNNQEALRFFDEAISHDYHLLDAYMDKGSLLYDTKKFKEAIKTFDLATTVSPTFAEAYYWRGKSKEAMNNKAEAKLDYLRAYGLDKTLTDAKDAAAKIKE